MKYELMLLCIHKLNYIIPKIFGYFAALLNAVSYEKEIVSNSRVTRIMYTTHDALYW